MTEPTGDNKKISECKVCGAEIAKNAKKCPHCGAKNKKPIYKRVWFIILCVIIFLSIIGAAMGGEDEENANVNTKPEQTVESTVEESTTAVKDSTADLTAAQKNAYQAGLNYIDFMGISKQGLIDQLSSEYGDDYEKSDAEVAVEAIEKDGWVDWNEEAVQAAENYLDTMSFSKDGLIEQLESSYGDQFTHDQAVQAVEKVYK